MALSVLASVLLLIGLLPVSLVSAQDSQILIVRAPEFALGNVTITGLAADCHTGEAATRVAIYDLDHGEAYLADASMDTIRNLSAACDGAEGAGQIGFTLIYDTNQIDPGLHTLGFLAEFPDGHEVWTTTVLDVGPWIDTNREAGRDDRRDEGRNVGRED